MEKPDFQLVLLPEVLAIARLAPETPLPVWLNGEPFYAVVRTPEELSIVTRQDKIPAGQNCVPGWRAFKVVGPLDFELVGIVAALTSPLALAGVPVFIVSSYDTDTILVPGQHLQSAIEALEQAGYTILQPQG